MIEGVNETVKDSYLHICSITTVNMGVFVIQDPYFELP